MLLLNQELLESAREASRVPSGSLSAEVEVLCRQADEILTQPLRSVFDKKLTAPTGDKRDYVSYGPYWWPNPETEDGLPYVRRDGELNPETHQLDRLALEETMREVETLTVAYFYRGDERWAAGAAERLRTWFVNPATRMNPHLQYGQGIPGVCEGRGIGIIDTVQLRHVPDCSTLLAKSSAWGEKDIAALTEWMSAYLDWLLTSEHGLDEAGQHNNHGTWYDVQVVLLALATDREAEAKRVLSEVPERRLVPQLAADGSQPHELARTLSLSYSSYNLAAFFDLARLGEHVGVDLWNWRREDGAGVKKALEFLLPWLSPDSEWPYPQIKPDNRSVLASLVRRARMAFPKDTWPATEMAQPLTPALALKSLLYPAPGSRKNAFFYPGGSFSGAAPSAGGGIACNLRGFWASFAAELPRNFLA